MRVRASRSRAGSTGRSRTERVAVSAAAVVAVAVAGIGGLGVGPAAAAPPAVTITGITPATAQLVGGETVSVTGQGFVEEFTWVELDEVPVDVTVQSPTALSFVAPPHAAGAVALRVVVLEIPSAPWSYEYVTTPPERIESPTPVPSSEDDGDQSVEPAPRPRTPEHTDAPRSEPDHPRLDPGSRIPPELAATGGATSATAARFGLAAVVLGTLLVLVGRSRPGTGLRR